MEELEAADWYDQRVDAADDAELRRILMHNRDEEKEHAAMLLEWLRRHDAALQGHLHTYLFTEESISKRANANEEGTGADSRQPASLGIGSLRIQVGET